MNSFYPLPVVTLPKTQRPISRLTSPSLAGARRPDNRPNPRVDTLVRVHFSRQFPIHALKLESLSANALYGSGYLPLILYLGRQASELRLYIDMGV